MKEKRPDIVREDHLTYLDDLRDSGVVNMYDAAPFLCNVFEYLNRKTATAVLEYWLKTYSDRHLKEG